MKFGWRTPVQHQHSNFRRRSSILIVLLETWDQSWSLSMEILESQRLYFDLGRTGERGLHAGAFMSCLNAELRQGGILFSRWINSLPFFYSRLRKHGDGKPTDVSGQHKGPQFFRGALSRDWMASLTGEGRRRRGDAEPDSRWCVSGSPPISRRLPLGSRLNKRAPLAV